MQKGSLSAGAWRNALVAARAAFVWQFSTTYLAFLLSILDIRDGGWAPFAGLLGAALFALVRQPRSPGLRKPLWAALATGAVIWGLGALALSIETVEARKMPPMTLVSLEGIPVRLGQFHGKPTVVNLWATWCPPCVREMPVLQQAQVNHPSVNFDFINAGEPPQRVHAWLQSRNLPVKNVLLDAEGELAAHFRSRGLPTRLFLDGNGALVGTRMGELSAATLVERLQAF